MYRQNKEFFNNFELDVEKCINVEGNWLTNKVVLQDICTPDINEMTSDYSLFRKKMDPIVKKLLRKIPFEVLPSPTVEDNELCEFNPKTLPGFRYKEYLKYQTKGEASKIALEIAKTRWNYIEKASRTGEDLDRNKLLPSIYSIGARNKRDYNYEIDEFVKSRAIHMPEFHVEINSACWIDPITESIVKSKRGAIYIGNTFLDYERFKAVIEDRDIIIEGDWKGFDSTLYKNIINLSISILRCFYNLKSKRIDNHFKAIYDSVAIKDYYCPGGELYRTIHGLPSGVKATNLLGSIINLLALGYCVGPENLKRIDFTVGGDDFIISPRQGISIDVDEMKKRSREIGMEFKFLYEKKQTSEKVDDLPTFYKYVIKDGKPITPSKALYERVFMPWSKRFKNIYEVEEHLRALIPTMAYPSTCLLPFYYYYAKILSICRNSKVEPSYVYNFHEYCNRKVFERKMSIKPEIAGACKYISEMDQKKGFKRLYYEEVFFPKKFLLLQLKKF